MTLREKKAAPKQFRRVDRERKVDAVSNPYRRHVDDDGKFDRGSNYTPRNRHPLTRQEKIQKAQSWEGRER